MTTPVETTFTAEWNVLQQVTTDVELQWDIDPQQVTKTFTVLWDIGAVDQPQRNQGFVLDLDLALKTKLQGLTTTDQKSAGGLRQVPVYFGMAEVEVRKISFPYITIDLISIERAPEREQRSGDLYIPYVPPGYTGPEDTTDWLHTNQAPIPYDFTWQVTTHARNFEDDRAIWGQLLANDRLPPRGGFLPCNGTVRQMFVTLAGQRSDVMGPEQNQRTFRRVWRVVASGELFQADLLLLTKPSTIDLDIANFAGTVTG